MYSGQLVFAQLMEHLPLHTFRRCVQRFPSKYPTKTFSHLDQFLCMAFAQLTYRESLRDIETCLRAHQAKLYHLGIRGSVARSTLTDANESRNCRIFADFAMSLIQTARTLYASDSFSVELEQTAYALDTTTIDLCLSVFPWAHFRRAKAAVKMHTLLDLRGNIPAFIHISDGKMHEVNVLDILIAEAGSFYIMDRGFTDFARWFKLHQVPRCRARQGLGIPDQQLRTACTDHRTTLPLSLAGRTILQMDQAASSDQAVLRHHRERSQNTDMDRYFRLRPGRHCEETAQNRGFSLHNSTDTEPDTFRKNST